MEKLLLGIDVGTSACKVAVFDIDGTVVAQSTKEYKVYYPFFGWAEQDPEEWWESICIAIREVIQHGKIDPQQIAGIGIDGQSWSCIPIDSKGNVLHRTPIWMDTRASEICRKTIQQIGFDRIFEVSGNAFEPTYTTPKILWFKEHEPDIYDETHKFLQSNSYIVYKLTGEITQDLSQGYGLHVFNMKTGKWDNELCDAMGIRREKLPDIFPCHQIIGAVNTEAAKLTGLAYGTPVVAGGLDAACGTLGAGVIQPGQTQEQGGQAGGMSICIDKPLAHSKLILGYHVIPNVWLLQGGTVAGGGSLKWFKEQLGAFEEFKAKEMGAHVFKVMDDEADKIRVGSEGLIFLPYLAGERSPLWDKYAKGVYFGLSFNTTRAHMIRALLEGCAYALHHNLQTAEETGLNVDELIAMGGGANSRLWTQIKADVTGKVIKVPASDTATTLGAAILAGMGTGVYKDYKEAVNRTIAITRVHEPNMLNHTRYQKYYDIYLELYEKLKHTMAKVSDINEL